MLLLRPLLFVLYFVYYDYESLDVTPMKYIFIHDARKSSTYHSLDLDHQITSKILPVCHFSCLLEPPNLKIKSS